MRLLRGEKTFDALHVQIGSRRSEGAERIEKTLPLRMPRCSRCILRRAVNYTGSAQANLAGTHPSLAYIKP